ncbi:MAG TPA: SUMF1/EgtB/PvdO family nonheme iron enzyme [Spirochaetota bacterium]|nr:SUMF1/EgtB/PvdO family nonheme iron enzyme [Spirochaetota bacterium]HRS77253.1 SUMF1/EgtB/PvdO family nonheme iron enzyme [Spirochaetota bacterium]
MIFNESEYIRIPAGDYSIGISPMVLDTAIGALKEGAVRSEFLANACPEHVVHVDDVFIRKTLATYRDFLAFAQDTGYLTEGERQGWGWIWQDGRWQKKSGVSWRCPFGTSDDKRYRNNDDMPVMQVSWNDAAAYCAWFSGRAGRSARLPREAEWEVFAGISGVCGMGDWARGTSDPPPKPNLLEAICELPGGSGHATGLLWEWVDDWYDRYPGGSDHRDFGTVYKVLRGGSVLSLPVQKTREFRLRKCPTARSPYYGFRVACFVNH